MREPVLVTWFAMYPVTNFKVFGGEVIVGCPPDPAFSAKQPGVSSVNFFATRTRQVDVGSE